MVQTIENLVFPVETRPIVHAGKPSGHQKIIRSDTKELISITTDKYLLIENDKVIDAVMNHFADRNLDLNTRKAFTNNATTRLELIVDKQYDILKNDTLKPMVSIENSYDTTKSLTVSLNAYRLICSNGMMKMTSVFTSKTKHIGDTNPDDVIANMLESLDKVDNNFVAMLQSFEKMADTKITTTIKDRFMSSLMNPAIPKYIQDEVVQKIVRTNPDNVWELYNCITYVTSHYLDFKKAASNTIESRLNKEIAQLF